MNTIQDTLSTMTVPSRYLAMAIMTQARKIFEERHSVSPAAFIIPEHKGVEDVQIVDLIISDDRTKAISWAFLRLMRRKNPVVALASECWVSQKKKNTGDRIPYVIPSEDPEREEYVLVYMWILSRMVSFKAKITRSPDSLGEWNVMHDSMFIGKDEEMRGSLAEGEHYPIEGN